MTIVGLISNNNEAPYREEVQTLSAWCRNHNLNLNTKKTKEIIIGFRITKKTHHTGLSIEEERVDSFKFLGVHISEDLSWSLNTSHLIKKAQQRLFVLRTLRHNRLPQDLLKNVYRCTIECLDLRLYNLVLRLHCSRKERPAVDHQNGSVNCWLPTFKPQRHPLEPSPQAGLKHHKRPLSPRTLPVHHPSLRQAQNHLHMDK